MTSRVVEFVRCALGATRATLGGNRSKQETRSQTFTVLCGTVIVVIFLVVGVSCAGEGGRGGITGPMAPGNPAPVTAASVLVSQDTATLVPAATAQLSATAKDGSGQVLSRSFTWASSDESKATVSPSGLVTGVGVGAAAIRVTADGKSATTNVTVRDGAVVPPTGALIVALSGTVRLVVPPGALAGTTPISIVPVAAPTDPRVLIGTAYAFGPAGTTFNTPASLTLKYDVSKLPVGSYESGLQLALLTAGGWQPIDGGVVDTQTKLVVAPVNHFSTYAVLIPSPVASVTITPSTGTLPVGGTIQFSASPTDSAGQALTGRQVSWVSTDPTRARVTSAGLVTGIAPGSTVIRATVEGKSSSVSLTVSLPTAASLSLGTDFVAVRIGQTTILAAAAKDSAGNTIAVDVAWQSSDSSVVSISSVGRATAVKEGVAVITATAGSLHSTAVVQAYPPIESVTISQQNPATPVAIGQHINYLVVAVAGGRQIRGPAIDVSSSDERVATVSVPIPSSRDFCIVSPHALGTATIRATVDGVTASLSITVVPVVPVANIVFVADTSATKPPFVGQGINLSASGTDANGQAIHSYNDWVWSNENPEIISMATYGASYNERTGVALTALAVGTARITASAGGRSATISIVVKANDTHIVLVPRFGSLSPAEIGTIDAYVADARGTPIISSTIPSIRFQSADSTIASIWNVQPALAGVQGRRVGRTEVTASVGPGTADARATIDVAGPLPGHLTFWTRALQPTVSVRQGIGSPVAVGSFAQAPLCGSLAPGVGNLDAAADKEQSYYATSAYSNGTLEGGSGETGLTVPSAGCKLVELVIGPSVYIGPCRYLLTNYAQCYHSDISFVSEDAPPAAITGGVGLAVTGTGGPNANQVCAEFTMGALTTGPVWSAPSGIPGSFSISATFSPPNGFVTGIYAVAIRSLPATSCGRNGPAVVFAPISTTVTVTRATTHFTFTPFWQ
jgi:trimeric autotransporter adhesin